jgi:hypothetical protein
LRLKRQKGVREIVMFSHALQNHVAARWRAGGSKRRLELSGFWSQRLDPRFKGWVVAGGRSFRRNLSPDFCCRERAGTARMPCAASVAGTSGATFRIAMKPRLTQSVTFRLADSFPVSQRGQECRKGVTHCKHGGNGVGDKFCTPIGGEARREDAWIEERGIAS